MKRMISKWSFFFIALLVGVFLAIIASTPPSPKGRAAPSEQFSSGRAMNDVRVIASKPHPTGSIENEKVRDFLVSRLTELGMQVSVSESQLEKEALLTLNQWRGEAKTEQAIFNIVGILTGKDSSKPALTLMAHHDTVWGSPGATDDTMGVAAILEITRALGEAENRQRDLIVLFSDAEELQMSGAIHFFNEHPLRNKIGAVINFEARGAGGTVRMFQTSRESGGAARLYARSVQKPGTSSLSTYVSYLTTYVYDVLPNYTDLNPALEKDYIAYNFANFGRAEYYHSPKIDADALEEGTLQHIGSQGLDLSRALLATNKLPEKKPDLTFFDLFGFFTVIYPPFLGWVFLIVAGLCYGGSLDRKSFRKELLGGASRMFGFLILSSLALHALNILSGAGSDANYYDRLAAIPKLEALSFLLYVAMFFTFFGQKTLSSNARFGAALPIFILGALGQTFAPTAAYFITLPLLLCGVSSLIISRWPSRAIASTVVCISTAVVLGYMLFLGHLLSLGIGPDILFVAILPAAITVLAVMPLYFGLSKNISHSLVWTGFVLSIGIAIWVRLDPIASTIPLY